MGKVKAPCLYRRGSSDPPPKKKYRFCIRIPCLAVQSLVMVTGIQTPSSSCGYANVSVERCPWITAVYGLSYTCQIVCLSVCYSRATGRCSSTFSRTLMHWLSFPSQLLWSRFVEPVTRSSSSYVSAIHEANSPNIASPFVKAMNELPAPIQSSGFITLRYSVSLYRHRDAWKVFNPSMHSVAIWLRL